MGKSLLVVLAVALPVSAWSQADAGGKRSTAYLQLRAGVVTPQAEDLDGYDSGPAFDLAVGFFLDPHVALEAGLGRFSISGEQTIYDPDLQTEVTGEGQPIAVPLTATLKLGVPLPGQGGFVYALVGAGVYFVSDNVKISAPGYGTVTNDDSSDAFGFHVGGGAAFNVGQQWTIGAEVRYLSARVELFDETNDIDSLTVQGALGFRF